MLHPSVEAKHLTHTSSEEELSDCIRWITESLKSKLKVSVLVKKPAEIDDIVNRAMEKKRLKDWNNRQKTREELNQELRDSLEGKIKSSQEMTDAKKSLKLLLECRDVYEKAEEFNVPELYIRIQYLLVIAYINLKESDEVYGVYRDSCLEVISTNNLQEQFESQVKQLQMNRIDCLLNEAQRSEDRPSTALQIYQNALEINQSLKTEQITTINIMLSIAHTYQLMSLKEKVVQTWIETLKLIELLGSPEEVTSEKKYVLFNIGQAYYEGKKESEALEYWLETIKIFDKQHDLGKLEQEEKPQYGQLHNYVGTIYYVRKDLKKAIYHMDKVVKIFVEIYGTQHLQVAVKLNSLGEAYRLDKQYESALEMFSRALEIKEKEFIKAPNKSYSNTLNNIALIFQALKKYDLAVRKFTETLEYYKKPGVYQSVSAGEGAQTYAATSHSLAECYKSLGELDGALRYFKEAFDLREQELGMTNKSTQSSAIQLASVYFQSAQFNESLGIFEKILSAQIQTYGTDNIVVGQSRNNIASVLTQLGRYQDALIQVEKALEIMEPKLDASDPNLKKTKEQKQQLLMKLSQVK